MKIGVAFANIGVAATPEGAHALVEACEELGVESVWTVEHAVVPAGYESPYPYSKDGKMPGGETAAIPDPFVWLAYAAARTTRLRLGTGITILPQRNPVLLAKEAATLDVMSSGRFSLGVGVGWLAEEFDVLGVPFEDRGPRTDEWIAVLRALWSEDETHHGERLSFTGARCYPKPAQSPLPIVIGGHSAAAARRAGRLGDGFFPAKSEAAEELAAVMRRAAEDAGRDPDAIELTTGISRDPERIRRLVDAGFSRFTIPPPMGTVDTVRADLEQLLASVWGML